MKIEEFLKILQSWFWIDIEQLTANMQNQCLYHHMCEILPVLLNHGHPEKDLMPIPYKETILTEIKLIMKIKFKPNSYYSKQNQFRNFHIHSNFHLKKCSYSIISSCLKYEAICLELY